MEYGDRRPSWGVLMAVVGVALLVGAISGGVSGALMAVLIPRNEPATPKAARTAEPEPPTTVLSLKEESTTVETVQRVLPGVVTLIVQAERRDAAGRVVGETNLGSGVVIDPRGYVLTNQHVVENQTKIMVKLASGEERPGSLIGDDSPFTDIAIVRIQPDNLTTIPIGDSDALALGQQVLAVGTVAFGSNLTDFRNNVTRGIVSGLHRRWPREDTVMEDLIQTDAAINHGNSGGALVNLGGELVGITTTVVRGTQSGFQVQGVAFAIPSKTFKPLADEIIRTGKVQRPYIGVQHRQLTPEIARQNGLPVQNGAVVLSVVENSPADKAGLRRNDIITRVAGTEITENNPYLNILVKQRPNSTVPVTYVRGGRETTVDLTIGLR
jgi:S1-C subfamily serine protease